MISKSFGKKPLLLLSAALLFSGFSANLTPAFSEDETSVNQTQIEQAKLRKRVEFASMPSGQQKIQQRMYELIDSWYQLSYVKNSTPASENKGDPYQNTAPGLACQETEVNVADNLDQFPLFASVPSNVYLGSVIRGDTLLTNTYGVFSGPKNSAKITVNAPYAQGDIGTQTMKTISQSEYLDALRRILKGGIGNVASNTAFQVEKVYSQDQLGFKMKANVSGKSFDVAAQFDMSSVNDKQYALISVTQLNFRVYFDRPDYGAQLFSETLTNADVKNILSEMSELNPPLYVSAIDYGRKAYILFETSDKSLDIKSTLSAGYRGAVDVDGSIDVEVKQALKSMSAKGFIIGGSSKLGANAIASLFSGGSENGLDAMAGIAKWLKDGAEPSDTNPPAALSYEFSLLFDGSKALARTTTEYTEKDCNVGVCPAGFFWGKKHYATWFEINVPSNPIIAPAGGYMDDIIEVQDGSFYTYSFPTCDRIYWRNVALQCVPNDRADFVPGKSPPGIWTWYELTQENPTNPDDPIALPREIGTDLWCSDSNDDQESAWGYRIDKDGETPVPLDGGDSGYAKSPQDYWKWRESVQ